MLTRGSGLGVLTCWAVFSLLGGFQAALAGDPAAVEFLADRSAAVPGQTVNLAIKFKIEENHYIFWRYPGDIGQAPSVKWSTPEGADFGELRFPVPEKLKLGPGKTANVLRYEPILLTELTVPKDAAPGQKLAIRGEARWVVGGSQTVDQSSTVELHLPIVSPGQEGEPTHKDVFEEAAYSMPVPANKAKHIKLHTMLKPAMVQPGGKASALFGVDIKKGFHLQAHLPGAQGLVGADLFLVPPAGVTAGKPVFPKGQTREVKYFGKVNEYVGQVTFEVPLEVSAEYAGDRPLEGLFLYQACDEKTGVCFPPQHVAWTLELPLGK